MIDKLIWIIPVICLTATAAFLIEPEKVDNVKYITTTKADMTSEYLEMPDAAYIGDVEGATYLYENGSIIIATNKDGLLRNWTLRHENCHARQVMENRTREEIECYIWMLIPN